MQPLATEIKGQAQLEQKLNKLSVAFDTTALLDESAAILLNSIRNRFLRGVDTDNTPWPVSHAAILRAKAGRGGGTLYDTGRLFHSLQEFAVDAQSRAIGTNVTYGSVHQFGNVKLPKREFLGFADRDLETIRNMLTRRAAEALQG